MLASVLLGTDPPWLPTPLLVRTGALFGITEGTVRTALSRMAASGEVERARTAATRWRAGWSTANDARPPAVRPTCARGTARGSSPPIEGDDARPAADRASLRDALGTLRLAELREGVWGRPDNLDARARAGRRAPWSTSGASGGEGARPDADPAPSRRCGTSTDGAAEAEPASRARCAPLLERLEAGDASALADGFVVSAAVLRLFQHDPLLPDELLPADWPGAALRDGVRPLRHRLRDLPVGSRRVASPTER